MFTAEIRVNGALIGTLHMHNSGGYADVDTCPYEYEYFEPNVGIKKEYSTRPQLTKGIVSCQRNLGIRHVLKAIFNDLDSKA